jgi:hypothetical protein
LVDDWVKVALWRWFCDLREKKSRLQLTTLYTNICAFVRRNVAKQQSMLCVSVCIG